MRRTRQHRGHCTGPHAVLRNSRLCGRRASFVGTWGTDVPRIDFKVLRLLAREKRLLRLAWPVVIARSTQAVIGLADAAMSAPLGQEGLAAVTTGAMNVLGGLILPMGIAFIVQSFAAQLKGQGRAGDAVNYGWYGLWMAGGFGVVALGLPIVVDPILDLFSYDQAVRAGMRDYIVTRSYSVFAVVGVEVLGNWFGGLGNTKPHMVAGVVSMLANIGLNWLLITGQAGAPRLEEHGAALASTLASWIGFGWLLRCFNQERKRSSGSGARLRWSEFVQMMRFGVPHGFNWFFEFAAFALFMNLVVAHLGTTVLAATMVVFNLNSVSFMPAFGVASAGAILAGQQIGAKHHNRVWPTLKLTLGTMLMWQCVVSCIYLAFPKWLLRWFDQDIGRSTDFVEVGALLLAISVLWQLFDAVVAACGEVLRAAGDTLWCLVVRLLIAWAFFVPVSMLVVFRWGGEHRAAMLCVVVYLGILALALAYRFHSGKWRTIKLVS